MNIAENEVRIGTHDGDFHLDEIVAIAELKLVYARIGKTIRVLRTRNAAELEKMHEVVDVGNKNDATHHDHHQGAGKRLNGVPYASAGLVWQKRGLDLCNGNKLVFELLDKKFFSVIDARDTRYPISKKLSREAEPYYFLVHAWRPLKGESRETTELNFLRLVDLMAKTIERAILHAKDEVATEQYIKECYDQSLDKRIIFFPERIKWKRAIRKYPEPVCVIYPKTGNQRSSESWSVEIVGKDESNHSKRLFPEKWAGKRGDALQRKARVPEAVYCNEERTMVITSNIGGAFKIAERLVA